MTKSLKVHPNQRVDLLDFELAAKDYTQESLAQHMRHTLLDRSRFLRGFRIEVADQTLNPGQVTVFNGFALDKEGFPLSNEEQANASRTVTLIGASTTFYLEVEFVESESDIDSRAFWDPTTTNTPPAPNGREFATDVSTRETPDWRIVTPVSTTGFQLDSNPNSTRLPLAVLTTNVSNELSGLPTAQAATVFANTYALGVLSVRLLDTTLFADTGTVNLGAGTPNAEVVNFVANDRVNGILSLAVPTINPHAAGEVAVVVGGAAFLSERLFADPNPLANADVRSRFFQASERRGGVLQSSYRGAGLRDDLQLAKLKDYVDFLSGQIRELKFGSVDPATTSAAPPTAFATEPRYYDRVGSVAGARTNTVSIGNGTTNFGDFNGTDETPFVAALASLPAGGGTIFVNPGTYVFSNTVTIPDNVVIVGSGRDATVIESEVVAAPAFLISLPTGAGIVEFQRLTVLTTTGANEAIELEDGRLHLTETMIRCVISLPVGFDARIDAKQSSFVPTGTSALGSFSTGTDVLQNSQFVNCRFSAGLVTFGVVTNTRFSNCVFNIGGFAWGANANNVQVTGSRIVHTTSLFAAVGASTDITLSACDITTTTASAANAVICGVGTGGSVSSFVMTGCQVASTFGASTEAGPAGFFVVGTGGTLTDLSISNCNFDVLTTPSYVCLVRALTGATLSRIGLAANNIYGCASALLAVGTANLSDIQISHNNILNPNTVTGTAGVVRITDDVIVSALRISGNIFRLTTSTFAYGVYVMSTALVSGLDIDDNQIYVTGDGFSSAIFVSAIPGTYPALQTNIRGNSVGVFVTTADSFVISVSFGGTVFVSDNSITQYANNGGRAINVSAYAAIVRGNTVLEAVASTAGDAYGVFVGATSQAQVIDNCVNFVANTVVGGSNAIAISVACDLHTQIRGNMVDMSGGTHRGIVYNGGGQAVEIQNNTVRQHAGVYGIFLNNTGTALHAAEVTGNAVTGMNRAGVAIGIGVQVSAGCSNLNVSKNAVSESDFHASHTAIQIVNSATCLNTAVNDNVLNTIATPSALRDAMFGNGIYVVGCTQFTVNHNNVRWSTGNTFGGHSIHVNTSNVGVINGNRVTPADTASRDEIRLSGGTDNVVINGNNVMVPGVTGIINIGAATNVVNTDNLLS